MDGKPGLSARAGGTLCEGSGKKKSLNPLKIFDSKISSVFAPLTLALAVKPLRKTAFLKKQLFQFL
jgi:hypothetical protein